MATVDGVMAAPLVVEGAMARWRDGSDRYPWWSMARWLDGAMVVPSTLGGRWNDGSDSDVSRHQFMQCAFPEFDLYQCVVMWCDSDVNRCGFEQSIPDFDTYKCEFV